MKRDGGAGEPGGSIVELYLSRLLAAHRPIEVADRALLHRDPYVDGSAVSPAAPADMDVEQEPAETDAGPDAPAAEPGMDAAAVPAETNGTPALTPGAESDPEPGTEAKSGPSSEPGSDPAVRPAAPDVVVPDAVAASAAESAADPAPVLDADLSDAGLIDRLKEQAAAVSAIRAAQFVTAAEFARRRSDTTGEGFGAGALSEFAVDEVAAALTLTRWSADRLLDDATRLTSTLTGALDALAGGRTDLVRARMVCRATASLPDDAASAVDDAVADRLPTSTTTQLKEVLAAEVIAVDPARAERATVQAVAERAVTCWPVDDGPAGPVGMAELRAVGPAPQVLDLMDALTAVATRPSPSCPTGQGIDVGPDGQPRGVDARRFDALVDLARGAADAVPGAVTRKPAVQVTVALSTLLGADEHPAHLDGYGPVTAGLARRIARTGTLRRLLTDPVTGVVVGADSHTHPWDHSLDPPGPDDPGGGGADDGPGDGPPHSDGGGGGRRGGSGRDGSGEPGSGDGARRPPDPSERPDDTGQGTNIGATGIEGIPRSVGEHGRASGGQQGAEHSRASGGAQGNRRSEVSIGSVTQPSVPPTASTLSGQAPAGVGDADPPAPPARRPAQDDCPVRAAGGGLYRPGRVLDRLVRTRDRHCAAPGCRRRAHACDVDHVIPYGEKLRGPTCACNLQQLCRHHHRMKHQTAWIVVRWHDGSRTWTTPTGHSYALDPLTALPRPGLGTCPQWGRTVRSSSRGSTTPDPA